MDAAEAVLVLIDNAPDGLLYVRVVQCAIHRFEMRQEFVKPGMSLEPLQLYPRFATRPPAQSRNSLFSGVCHAVFSPAARCRLGAKGRHYLWGARLSA